MYHHQYTYPASHSRLPENFSRRVIIIMGDAHRHGSAILLLQLFRQAAVAVAVADVWTPTVWLFSECATAAVALLSIAAKPSEMIAISTSEASCFLHF